MGDTTGISWCDATFNPWIGCTKVSEGCKFCYAERENHIYKWNGGEWGPGAPRKRTSAGNWKKPLAWNRQAEREGVRKRVFCASLADVFDEEVPHEWRRDLFSLILKTPHLDWLILTKRAEAMKKYIDFWQDYIIQYGDEEDRAMEWPLPNVWLGVSAESQKWADKRIPVLMSIPAVVRFVSIEPMLGPIDIKDALPVCLPDGTPLFSYRNGYKSYIHWVIAGGESGPDARPALIKWFELLRDQCAESQTAFFMKQLGGHPDKRDKLEDLPEDLRIRQFPVVNS